MLLIDSVEQKYLLFMIIMHFFSFFTQFLIYLGWIIKM